MRMEAPLWLVLHNSSSSSHVRIVPKSNVRSTSSTQRCVPARTAPPRRYHSLYDRTIGHRRPNLAVQHNNTTPFPLFGQVRTSLGGQASLELKKIDVDVDALARLIDDHKFSNNRISNEPAESDRKNLKFESLYCWFAFVARKWTEICFVHCYFL